MKVCAKCGVQKPLSQYSKKPDTKDLLQPSCKVCVAVQNKVQYLKKREARLEYQKQHYLKNAEDIKAYGKSWRLENKDHSKQYDLIRIYGITQEEKLQMIKRQNGNCAICENELVEDRSTHVDHCHETLKVRGILCHGCNTGIGLFKESVSALKSAIKYLELHAENLPK